VYEFDLKQFFPSVNILRIAGVLRDLGVPKDFVDYIFEINQSYPTLPKDKLMDETDSIKKAIFKIFKHNELKSEIQQIFQKESVPVRFAGVPQGSGLGPLLSILLLKEFLSQRESVSYADDGLFFSNEEFTIKGDA
jgi:retron-type reverse transcriptase